VVGAEPGGGAGAAGGGGDGAVRRGSADTQVRPTQVSPSRQGGEQTNGSVGSGSAAVAVAAPPTASAAAANTSKHHRRRIPVQDRTGRFVSQAGYDCPFVSLRAPIAVPVEIRAPKRRVFRLAANVGEDGIRLQRGASFEPGRPVDVRFALPDGGGWTLTAIVAEGEAQDDELTFIDPPSDAREAMRRYVHGRLGLPGWPA
jgi:hypothetical protein